MSAMFELYYKTPVDSDKEARVLELISLFNGELTYREESHNTVCLTFEFMDRSPAENANAHLLRLGEHVEGIQDY